jgi:predicted nucleotidyltransferase
LHEVQTLLAISPFLTELLGTKWGYFFLQGKDHLVRERLNRHAIAQDKWKRARASLQFLAVLPFVRALAGSGSLAVDNTKESSDLDIFVIAKSGRVWTTRLLLLLMSTLLGRRRKYYDRSAPDMLCLNHYITDDSLVVSPEIQNVVMAMQYVSLVPLYGDSLIREFLQRNAVWIDANVRIPVRPDVKHQYTTILGSGVEFVKRQVELLLLEPLGDFAERMAEAIQRFVIERHRSGTYRGRRARSGRIVLSYHELAFHPDTKVPAIVTAFNKK